MTFWYIYSEINVAKDRNTREHLSMNCRKRGSSVRGLYHYKNESRRSSRHLNNSKSSVTNLKETWTHRGKVSNKAQQGSGHNSKNSPEDDIHTTVNNIKLTNHTFYSNSYIKLCHKTAYSFIFFSVQYSIVGFSRKVF